MDNDKEKTTKLICTLIVVVAVAVAVAFFMIIAGLTWVICWGFEKAWSWKVAIGATVLMIMVIFTLRVGNS